MEFAELKGEIKTIGFESVRLDGKDLFEAVVLKQNLTALVSKLDKFFGAPVWPSENPLPQQAKEVVKDCGGIWPGQTLYFWHQNNLAIFAMLWPWSDGEHTTLKCGYK